MQARDIVRLFLVLGFALIIGWAFGSVLLALLGALALYCMWLHRQVAQLLSWIRDRKHHEAPDTNGVFADLRREIDYLRNRDKKRKKKLRTYLKQFQKATRALPDGTVILDEHGSVKWANAAATACLGIRWPGDKNQRITNLIRMPELVEFVEVGTKNSSIDITSPIDPDIQLSVRLIPYGNNQRLFVARDVTDLHRADQIRSDFVANVSHELKTPITVLRGYLETMQAQPGQCPPAWQTGLDQMSEHVSRMQAVVEDLLTLSKLEQKDQIANPAPVAVADLVTDIHRQSQSVGAYRDHLFALEIDTNLGILGSGKELFSCFSNLVLNAINYTDARGVIEIQWYRDEYGAHFSVTDNGKGIAAVGIPRLTERFYRTDRSRARAHGGTGLGLAIVKHVLTRHGAALHIESQLGVGSTFRCDFPLDCIVETQADSAQDKSA